MPLYDRSCAACGWERADCYEQMHAPNPPCPTCGQPTRRVWLIGSRVTVIPDSIPGGRVVENLGHDPVKVYSQSELKREMTARGLQPFVRHQGERGSDKSKHTTRWI